MALIVALIIGYFFFFAPKINLVLTARKLTNTGSKKRKKIKKPSEMRSMVLL